VLVILVDSWSIRDWPVVRLKEASLVSKRDCRFLRPTEYSLEFMLRWRRDEGEIWSVLRFNFANLGLLMFRNDDFSCNDGVRLMCSEFACKFYPADSIFMRSFSLFSDDWFYLSN